MIIDGILLLLILRAVRCDNIGIAQFPQIKQQEEILKLTFRSQDKHVTVSSNLFLGDRKLSWKIHTLPVKMGSDPCSEHTLGECYKCEPTANNDSNQHRDLYKQCIEGDSLSQNAISLTDCASLLGRGGLVGRSIVITLEDSSSSPNIDVYCSTIHLDDNTHSQHSQHFMSTIAWFQTPYSGFVAFRKQDQMQSYIIVNLTRVKYWESDHEELKWDIRDDDDKIYHPGNQDLTSQTYGSDCHYTAPMNCAQGDLWRKHVKLMLYNNKVYLNMFIDTNLDSEILIGKRLKLYKTINGTKQLIISSVLIEDYSPIRVDVPFMDESVLSMLQRDPWSVVQHWYNATKHNSGRWFVKVFLGPTIQIFTGEMWQCERMWTHFTYLPEFETGDRKAFLNQTYTFYGRDSMIYRGVSIREDVGTKTLCSTITYRKGEELIGYSKLAYITSWSDRSKGQHAIVLIIEHTTLRQTTFLIATMCREFHYPLFFVLNERESCSSNNIYNPYNVCPALAQCSPDTQCSKHCSSASGCCSMCSFNSSSVCPLGDFRRRLGFFTQSHTNLHNMEVVFAVKNDLDLPLNLMINKYLGLRIYQEYGGMELVRCGQVHELEDSKITIKLYGGNVTLSQKSPWQPLTVSWVGVHDISLKFWRIQHFSNPLCKRSVDDDNAAESYYSSSDLRYSPKTLPYSSAQLSFFGPHSVLGKSLTIDYTTSGNQHKTTTLNLKPNSVTNSTNNIQCIYRSLDNVNYIKFEFMQRKSHLTEETYITVEILHKKFCNTNAKLKWYLIDKLYGESISEGSEFKPTGYDDQRFLDVSTPKRECPFPTPYNTMGDLSGIFGDIKLDGPGKIYRHDTLPLLQAEGHLLLLANESNIVIAKLELKKSPKIEPHITYKHDTAVKSNLDTKYLIICIAFGVIIMLVGTVVCYRCSIHRKPPAIEKEYAEVPTNPSAPSSQPYINMETKRFVLLYTPGPNWVKCKERDCLSGEEAYFHPDVYRKTTPEEERDLKLFQKREQEYREKQTHTHNTGSMNGSTNGSTLNRSRGTLTEENHYVTSLPRNYLVNEDVSPESSIDSSVSASSPSSTSTSRSNI